MRKTAGGDRLFVLPAVVFTSDPLTPDDHPPKSRLQYFSAERGVDGPSITQLTELLPPPKGVGGRNTNWPQVEKAIKLTFPGHFKDLLNVYGDSTFFDRYYILYPAASSLEEYKESVRSRLQILVDYGICQDGMDVEMPLYPEPGGLFPFMVSSDGDYYYWNTESEDPNEWPMMQWQANEIITLEFPTIAGLFLDALEWIKANEPESLWVRPRTGN